MNNEIKQQISEFLDDELDSPAALGLLKHALRDSEIGATLNRYTIINRAIKNEHIFLDDGVFFQQVSERLRHEPTYLLPKQNKANASQHRYKIIALAASAAIVMVLGSQVFTQSVVPDSDTARFALAKLSTDETPAKPTNKDDAETTPLNQRIYDYLQAHNNGVYTSGNLDYKPLVKVTAYSSNQ